MASITPITDEAKVFWQKVSSRLQLWPAFAHSSRAPALPALLDGFTDLRTNKQVELVIAPASAVAGVADGNGGDRKEQAAASSSASAASTTPSIQQVVDQIARSMKTNPLESAMGLLFLYPLPPPGGVLVAGPINRAMWQALIQEESATIKRCVGRTLNLYEKTQLERALLRLGQDHFRNQGAIPGYRLCPTTVDDYRKLVRTHRHHTLHDLAAYRRLLTRSRSRGATTPSPLPAIFGTVNNSVAALVDLVNAAPGAKELNGTMTLLTRMIIVTALQYWAFANGRLFERDPQSLDFNSAMPPFIVLFFSDCDVYTSLARDARVKGSSGVGVDIDAVDAIWDQALTEDNVDELVVLLPLRIFLLKLLDYLSTRMAFDTRRLRDEFAKRARAIMQCNFMGNPRQFFTTMRFACFDVAPSFDVDMAKAFGDAGPSSRKTFLTRSLTKCYVAGGNIKMRQVMQPHEWMCDRLVPMFLSHLYLGRYTPVFSTSLEQLACEAELLQALGCSNASAVPRFRVFPLKDKLWRHCVIGGAADGDEDDEEDEPDGPLEQQQPRIDEEMQRRICIRKVKLQDLYLGSYSRFATRADQKIIDVVVGRDYVSALGHYTSRPFYGAVSQEPLLPMLPNELVRTPVELLPSSDTDVDEARMDAVDFQVRMRQRQHNTLLQSRYAYFISRSEFHLFTPGLHLPTETYPEAIEASLQAPLLEEHTSPFDAAHHWTRFDGTKWPLVVSPVYSLTTSAFYALYRRGRARLYQDPNVRIQGRTLLFGNTTDSRHSLFYVSDARDASTRFPESDGWVVRSFAASHAFVLRLHHGNIFFSTAERRQLAENAAEVLHLLLSASFAASAANATCLLSATMADTYNAMRATRSDPPTPAVFLLYRLLHFFFAHEEDIIYAFVRLAGADDVSILNNGAQCTFDETGFRMPPFMSLLHRQLLRACIADEQSSERAFETLLTQYHRADAFRVHEMHPAYDFVQKCIIQWDRCTPPKLDIDTMAGLLRPIDLVHMLRQPRVWCRWQAIVEALGTLPVVQAIASSVTLQYERRIQPTMRLSEADLWKLLTKCTESSNEPLVEFLVSSAAASASGNRFYTPDTADNAPFTNSLVYTPPVAVVDNSAANTTELLQSLQPMAVAADRRPAALCPVLMTAPLFLKFVFAFIHANVLRPIRRLLYHRMPTDMVTFEGRQTWAYKLTHIPESESFIVRAHRLLQSTLINFYREELASTKLVRKRKLAVMRLANEAGASASSSSSSSASALFPLSERIHAEIAAAAAAAPSAVADAEADERSEDEMKVEQLLQLSVPATQPSVSLDMKSKLSLVYAMAPEQSRLRQDMGPLMHAADLESRTLFPGLFLTAEEAQNRLYRLMGMAIVVRQAITPTDVDEAFRLTTYMLPSDPFQYIAYGVVKPLMTSGHTNDYMERLFPPDRVMQTLSDTVLPGMRQLLIAPGAAADLVMMTSCGIHAYRRMFLALLALSPVDWARRFAL